MGYIGQTPTAVPLNANDLSDDIIDSQHYANTSIDTAHIADDQITLAKMASGTDGNLITYDASGNPAAVATGNDGQVLTSAGAGAAPAFETLSAGKILQCLSTAKTDTWSLASSTFTDIPSLTVDITPAATSSKILIFGHISDSMSASSSNAYRIMRDSTAVGIGTAAGNRQGASSKSYHTGATSHSNTVPYFFLDSPSSTSELTYKIQMSAQSSRTGYINQTAADGDYDDAYAHRGICTITVMEIGA